MRKFIKKLLGMPTEDMDYSTMEKPVKKVDKHRKQSKIVSSKLIEFIEITEENMIFDAAETMKEKPIVVNFEKLDEESANSFLSFLSGVTFALDGEIIKLKPQIFLFARAEHFVDGSLKVFASRFTQGE